MARDSRGDKIQRNAIEKRGNHKIQRSTWTNAMLQIPARPSARQGERIGSGPRIKIGGDVPPSPLRL